MKVRKRRGSAIRELQQLQGVPAKDRLDCGWSKRKGAYPLDLRRLVQKREVAGKQHFVPPKELHQRFEDVGAVQQRPRGGIHVGLSKGGPYLRHNAIKGQAASQVGEDHRPIRKSGDQRIEPFRRH